MSTPFPSKSNALRRLKAAGLGVATVLDVGAHEQTVELRLAFARAKHVLFEPAEDFHAKIHANYAGMDYELVPLAISHTDGVGSLKKFDIDGGGVSHSTLVDPSTEGVESVPTQRLDTFLSQKNYAGPFLLKIDVDGYEIPIIESLGAFAANVACVIVEATKDTFVERLNALASRGFQLFDIVDPCYYAGMFSQADLICVSPQVAAWPTLRPWENVTFGWEKWVPIASFESLITQR
ncbi:FkbM family methyltransferase [Phenylobacterium sp. VNQ135]|uniref:FkbM family methyltransferase n=1 Tax=Phenylobacterium sp. VNQ135 TaxID=3400922 RepID=UPI003C0F419C